MMLSLAKDMLNSIVMGFITSLELDVDSGEVEVEDTFASRSERHSPLLVGHVPFLPTPPPLYIVQDYPFGIVIFPVVYVETSDAVNGDLADVDDVFG